MELLLLQQLEQFDVFEATDAQRADMDIQIDQCIPQILSPPLLVKALGAVSYDNDALACRVMQRIQAVLDDDSSSLQTFLDAEVEASVGTFVSMADTTKPLSTAEAVRLYRHLKTLKGTPINSSDAVVSLVAQGLREHEAEALVNKVHAEEDWLGLIRRIQGLVNASQHNGKICVVTEVFDKTPMKLGVYLLGEHEHIKIAPDRLAPLGPQPVATPAPDRQQTCEDCGKPRRAHPVGPPLHVDFGCLVPKMVCGCSFLYPTGDFESVHCSAVALTVPYPTLLLGIAGMPVDQSMEPNCYVTRVFACHYDGQYEAYTGRACVGVRSDHQRTLFFAEDSGRYAKVVRQPDYDVACAMQALDPREPILMAPG